MAIDPHTSAGPTNRVSFWILRAISSGPLGRSMRATIGEEGLHQTSVGVLFPSVVTPVSTASSTNFGLMMSTGARDPCSGFERGCVKGFTNGPRSAWRRYHRPDSDFRVGVRLQTRKSSFPRSCKPEPPLGISAWALPVLMGGGSRCQEACPS